LRISHDGMDGGAKAPIDNRVEVPNAPATKARREIAAVFVGDGALACSGGAAGGFVDGDGVVLGCGVGFVSSNMFSVALE